MDVQKQIDYWVASAEEDFAAAHSLFDKGHLRHALFFAHLALEKMLKAHVTQKTAKVPPRTHNLLRLAELAGLVLEPVREVFLRGFGVYQLEGRYPDSAQVSLDLETARGELSGAWEMLEWFKTQL
ncbi:MAG: HEPN domain-containing protein [Planctomycetota bacterium]